MTRQKHRSNSAYAERAWTTTGAEEPFFIFGLPRSRTAWLAHAFTHGPIHCFHDLSEFGGPLHFKQMLCATRGVADTGMIHFAEQLAVMFPGCPAVVVLRPLEEVREALSAIDIPDAGLQTQWERLHILPRIWNGPVLFTSFNSIDEDGANLWEHCIQGAYEFDPERWARLCNFRIEVRLGEKFSANSIRG